MRNYNEYLNSPKLIEWLNIVPAVADELFTACQHVRQSYDIDTATTYELDVLERLVVVRDSAKLSTLPVGLDLTNVRRLLIKAKIIKNTSNATYDSVLDAIYFLTGDSRATIVDSEDMTFLIQFNNDLTPEQRYILSTFDVVPRMAAVQFKGFIELSAVTQFGDSTKQFGDNDTQFTYTFGV